MHCIEIEVREDTDCRVLVNYVYISKWYYLLTEIYDRNSNETFLFF